MKRYIFAVLVSCFIAAPAWAADFSAIACTKDHKSVALKIELRDNASARVQSNIRLAFRKAAVQLTAGDLATAVGFKLFMDGITEDTRAAMIQIPGPPVTFGECK